MENFQNENGPRLEKGWEPLVYTLRLIQVINFSKLRSTMLSTIIIEQYISS